MNTDTDTSTTTQPAAHPLKSSSPEYIAGAIVIAGGLVAAAILYVNGAQPTPAQPATAPTGAAPTAKQIDPESVVVELEGYPSLGDPDAPILMVEYSDYSCSFCKRHNDETKAAIVEKYVDAGLVQYVRKDLITVGTPLTAEAAYCAQDQDAYWEYHDLLFVNQAGDRSVWNQEATFVGYADTLGLNTSTFADCLANDTHAAKVAASSREASSYGGTGTPFFLINGNPVSGAQPLAAFEQGFASLGVTVE